jgi:hypothetical protein
MERYRVERVPAARRQFGGRPDSCLARPELDRRLFRGRDNHLYQKSCNGSKWRRLIDLGGGLHSDIAVSSWGPDRLDLFRKGDDNALEHRSWDGKNWTDWVTIGSGITDTPSAVSWGRNRIDVLALGIDAVSSSAWPYPWTADCPAQSVTTSLEFH